MISKVKEIYTYRQLIINLTTKDLKLKYKSSFLGFLWSLLNPLMMLIVYTFAFKYILGLRTENFPLFILSGFLPWTFFQLSITGSTMAIVSNGNLVKKVYFPREIIVISPILANVINFIITLSILFIGIILAHIEIGMPICFLGVIIILLLVFTIGLGLLVSSINVIYRDMQHFIEVLFMAWFYITPIVYSVDLVPKELNMITYINPMTAYIESIRCVTLYNRLPSPMYIYLMFVYAIVFFILGSFVFSKIEYKFAEEV